MGGKKALQRFTELRVWRRAHSFALRVYKVSKEPPADERFGLISQLRRAVISVPANIAEGSKREGRQDYARFLNIAEGSLVETEYFLIFCRDLGYLKGDIVELLLAELNGIAKMLYHLRIKVAGGPGAPASRAA